MQGGYFHSFNNYTTMCSQDEDCNWLRNDQYDHFTCIKSSVNPNGNLMNFDWLVHCIIVIFQIVTGQSISTLYSYLNKTFFGGSKDFGFFAGILRDVFLFSFRLILSLIVFFYIAILKNIYSDEEKRMQGTVKTFLAELILTNNIKKVNSDDEIEDDTVLEVKDLKSIPKSYKSCKEIAKLQRLNKVQRQKLLKEIFDERNQGEIKFVEKSTRDLKKLNDYLSNRNEYFMENPGRLVDYFNTVKGQIFAKYNTIMNNPLASIDNKDKEETYLETDNDYKASTTDRIMIDEKDESKEEESLYISLNNIDSSTEREILVKEKTRLEETQITDVDTSIISSSSVLKMRRKLKDEIRMITHKKRSRSIRVSKYNFDVLERKFKSYKIIPKKQIKKINQKNRKFKYLFNLLDTNFQINPNFKRYFNEGKILK